MIINHNMNAMNAHRLMTGNTSNAGKSMEKLSSGLRINRAGDDAAGLAISEKMRAQIRGLDQASRNSQDGISMIQTAEGALNETHSILQRMRELATQASNDTNVTVDRSEIQKEMNQLSSEINRIGNTTEFNTQKVLQGSSTQELGTTGVPTAQGKLASGANATTIEVSHVDDVTTSFANADTLSFNISGQNITLTFATSAGAAAGAAGVNSGTVTGTSATIGFKTGSASLDENQGDAVANALTQIIAKNDTLKGNFTVTGDGTGKYTITASPSGNFAGAKGYVTATATGTGAVTAQGASVAGSDVAAVKASKEIDFGAALSSATAATETANIAALVGKGITVGKTQIEFYDASKGAYTGNAVGVDVSAALATAHGGAGDQVEALVSSISTQLASTDNASKFDVTFAAKAGTPTTLVVSAKTGGLEGNNIEIKDGGVASTFKATLQVGSNKGQGFNVEINDMRSLALKVTGTAGTDATEGATFTTTNVVSNGTDSTLREAALDVSSYDKATAAIKVINNAIESVSTERSKLGAYQNRLEHTIANLGTSSENLSSAESRIRDVDMAKEMMNFSKSNILSQAAQAMLAQANQQPQGVLQLLR